MNILKKIKKKIILKIVNIFLTGTHCFGIKRTLLNCCDGIKVGLGTKIVAPIRVPIFSNLEIGENCWLGHDFIMEGNGKVEIGNNCDLGPNVTFLTGSHEIGNEHRRAGKGYNGIITIGDGSWIGAKVVILSNVKIGDAVVIGAASIVTRKLKDNTLYVGNPAKQIRLF